MLQPQRKLVGTKWKWSAPSWYTESPESFENHLEFAKSGGTRLVFINTGMQKQGTTSSFSIGEVADLLQVSVETIRLYERRGLIIISKTDGNQRIFTEQDVERLRCIRTAINDHKISIEGIRRIQSLVPCWEHIGCSIDQREACPAFLRTDAGCWTYRKTLSDTARSFCKDRECRDCKVYQLSGDCARINTLIHLNTFLKSDSKEE